MYKTRVDTHHGVLYLEYIPNVRSTSTPNVFFVTPNERAVLQKRHVDGYTTTMLTTKLAVLAMVTTSRLTPPTPKHHDDVHEEGGHDDDDVSTKKPYPSTPKNHFCRNRSGRNVSWWKGATTASPCPTRRAGSPTSTTARRCLPRRWSAAPPARVARPAGMYAHARMHAALSWLEKLVCTDGAILAFFLRISIWVWQSSRIIYSLVVPFIG